MIINNSKYNKNWQTKTLNELGSFRRGKSKHRPRNDKALFENGNYPLIQTGEIKEANLYITNHINTYNEFGLKQSKLWPKNTLCITIAANIAETAILKYPMCFPDSVVGFNAFENESSELFMHYVFTYIKRTIQNAASGSIQDNINIDFLTNLNFKIPNKEKQDIIAKVLSDLDAKIELNNKINTELEAMAKTLYDYWFVQFDFPDANGKPYKTSGGKMLWNEELKREIPEGWEVKTLLDIAIFTNGLACQKFRPNENEDSYRVIKIREMGTGFTENSEYVSINIPEKVVITNGDILFSWSATLDVKIWTGGIGALNQHIFKITSKDFPKSYYYFELLNYLQHFKMQAELRKTTMGHITQDHLKQSRITIPTLDLIIKLDTIIKPILEKKVKLEEENQELASLRDWLLPMLMNGQVTVGNVQKELDMVAEPVAIYEKTEKKIIEKVKKAKPTAIKLNPVDVYKRTLLAAEIVFQLKDTYTLGHLKLQKMLFLCQELENMALPMNFLKQAMGPYDNQLARSLDKQFVEKKWFEYQKEASLKFKPLENCGKHRGDFNKYFEDQLEGINYLIKKFTIFTSTQIEAVATLYACWKEAIENKELINDKLIITKFYNWSREKEKFKEENLVKALAWMRKNGIEPKTKLNE
jgi:type I restriction enzyme S subunit